MRRKTWRAAIAAAVFAAALGPHISAGAQTYSSGKWSYTCKGYGQEYGLLAEYFSEMTVGDIRYDLRVALGRGLISFGSYFLNIDTTYTGDIGRVAVIFKSGATTGPAGEFEESFDANGRRIGSYVTLELGGNDPVQLDQYDYLQVQSSSGQLIWERRGVIAGIGAAIRDRNATCAAARKN